MLCIRCNNSINETSQFCSICGAKNDEVLVIENKEIINKTKNGFKNVFFGSYKQFLGGFFLFFAIFIIINTILQKPGFYSLNFGAGFSLFLLFVTYLIMGASSIVNGLAEFNVLKMRRYFLWIETIIYLVILSFFTLCMFFVGQKIVYIIVLIFYFISTPIIIRNFYLIINMAKNK